MKYKSCRELNYLLFDVRHVLIRLILLLKMNKMAYWEVHVCTTHICFQIEFICICRYRLSKKHTIIIKPVIAYTNKNTASFQEPILVCHDILMPISLSCYMTSFIKAVDK